jgi:hypothetical protein
MRHHKIDTCKKERSKGKKRYHNAGGNRGAKRLIVENNE